jgi:hypothetical protein
MNTADGVEISVGGRYWVPTEDEFSTVLVTVVKIHLPKKDDLFADFTTVEVVSEDERRWHDFPFEMHSTKESCVSDIIARNERKRDSMYDQLEKHELRMHALKNGEC